MTKGDIHVPIELPAIDGTMVDSTVLTDNIVMISFFRFATCPLCNMRIHQLIKHYDDFGKDFEILAIFESPLEHLKKYTAPHQAPFPILADEHGKYYQQYRITKSYFGVIKGMFTRWSTLWTGMRKFTIPFPIKGSLWRMPADFIVDKNGMIIRSYYGTDEGDHMPIKDIVRCIEDYGQGRSIG